MAPIHKRGIEDQIAELGAKVAALLSAQAQGPILASYTYANLPPSPPTGLEVYVSDLGLRAWYNGTTWVFPPQQIAQRLLTVTTASVPITIPAVGFNTLRVTWSGSSNDSGAATYMCLRLNGDTGTNYLWDYDQGATATPGAANSGAAVDRIRVGTMPAAAATAGYVGAGEFVIPGASGSTFKAATGRSGSITSTTAGFSGTYGGLWLNTGAVNTVTLLPLNGSLLAGTSISVYGS